MKLTKGRYYQAREIVSGRLARDMPFKYRQGGDNSATLGTDARGNERTFSAVYWTIEPAWPLGKRRGRR